MVEIPEPKQYSPQDFIPAEWLDDNRATKLLFRHYSSSMLALSQHDQRIWEQARAIAAGTKCAIAGIRVSSDWKIQSIEYNGTVYNNGISPIFSVEDKKLPKGDYLLIISAHFHGDGQGNSSYYRADLAVAALKSLLGEHVADSLQLEFQQEPGNEKQTYASPSYRVTTSYADKAIIYTDTKILEEAIVAIYADGHTRASLQFYHKALTELNDPMRAVLYCSAIEALQIGNKIIGALVKVYAGILNEEQVKNDLMIRKLNNYRNDFLHKGAYTKFDDGLERLTQFAFWDCLSFKATGSHNSLALQMAQQIEAGDAK